MTPKSRQRRGLTPTPEGRNTAISYAGEIARRIQDDLKYQKGPWRDEEHYIDYLENIAENAWDLAEMVKLHRKGL